MPNFTLLLLMEKFKLLEGKSLSTSEEATELRSHLLAPQTHCSSLCPLPARTTAGEQDGISAFRNIFNKTCDV